MHLYHSQAHINVVHITIEPLTTISTTRTTIFPTTITTTKRIHIADSKQKEITTSPTTTTTTTAATSATLTDNEIETEIELETKSLSDCTESNNSSPRTKSVTVTEVYDYTTESDKLGAKSANEKSVQVKLSLGNIHTSTCMLCADQFFYGGCK